ncbi:unnamed protein product [Periconia digitata]|uniref:Uncharacterized protein n=1 Tax=Periconia digitata TaxID=1303443 RepID=A0A9W4UQ30_9PLEO|nr:unnamed protein product [Periconia digitata]
MSSPLIITERDKNIGGRASGAVGMSDASSGRPKAPRASSTGNTLLFRSNEPLPLAPGVHSMLRTSTEMGSVGGLTSEFYAMPAVNQRPRRAGATSRTSMASSHSGYSNRLSQPQNSSWRRSQSRQSRENNVPQYLPDTLSPTVVNIAGSSPLIPTLRKNRDGPRSLSMTATLSSGTHPRPSQHYSVISARSYDLIRPSQQRSESPGMQQSLRVQMRSSRTPSPALSDIMGQQQPLSRSNHRHRSYGPPFHGQPRHGQQPDSFQGGLDSGYHRTAPASRSSSSTPVYIGDVGAGMTPVPLLPIIPPLPPYRHPMLVPRGTSQRSRRSNGSTSQRSGQQSFSSQSTNQRLDSEGPSSDAASPPTPPDNQASNRLIRPLSILHSSAQEKATQQRKQPLFYDGSEAFEALGLDAISHEPTIMEEQVNNRPMVEGSDVTISKSSAEMVATNELEVAELPVSPVPHRLTRDLVKSYLGSQSTTGNFDSSLKLPETTSQYVGQTSNILEMESSPVDLSTTPHSPSERSINRFNMPSQAGTSVKDSPALKFVMESAIPMVVEKGIPMDTSQDNEDELAEGSSTRSPTEDGMSDLLDGYEYTDAKTEGVSTNGSAAGVNGPAEKSSIHVTRSSDDDEQSFKSCAYVPAPNEKSDKNSSRNSSESNDDLPRSRTFRVGTSAGSFPTCDKATTPDRMNCIPAAVDVSYRTINSIALQPDIRSSFPQPPAGVPSVMRQNKHTVPHSTLTGLQSTNRRQSFSHPPEKSSSAPLLENGNDQSPIIPPRQSSSKLIASLFFRPFRNRRSRTSSDMSQTFNEDLLTNTKLLQEGCLEIPTPPPLRDRQTSLSISSALGFRRDTEKRKARGVEHGSNVSEPGNASRVLSHRLFNTLPPTQQSSASSPHNNTPFDLLLQTSDQGQRNSQSTTHISLPIILPDQPSINVRDFPQRGISGKEKSTTDLAKPEQDFEYFSKHQSYNLSGSKEDMSDNSGLDTSADNLKRSSLYISYGGSPQDARSARCSTENAAVFVQEFITQPTTELEVARALPSLNFTENDMIKDILDTCRSSSSNRASETAEMQLSVGSEPQKEDIAPKKKCPSLFDPSTGNITLSEQTTMSTQTTADDKKRNLSPLLIKAIEELNIPNTQELDDRFSEYMVTEHADGRGGLAYDENVIESAIDEIHEVGGEPSNKASKARLRAVPGSPEMVVIDDQVYETITSSAVLSSTKGGGARDVALPTTTNTTTPLRPPSASLSSPLSLNFEDEESFPLRDSLSSFHSAGSSSRSTSSAKARPWNSSQNYPWADTPSFDIVLPAVISPKSFPRPGPSHLRYSSYASSSTPAPNTAAPSPLPLSVSPPLDCDGSFGTHSREKLRLHSRSWSNRAIRSRGTDILPTINETSWPPGGGHLQDANVTHVVGGRYPTSSLPLPDDFHLPAHDVDGSLYTSDDEPGPPLKRQSRSDKKRLRHDVKSHLQEQLQYGIGQPSELPARRNRNTFTGVEGMSKSTYRLKSAVNKIKDFGRKVAHRIRNLSPRKTEADLRKSQILSVTNRADPRCSSRN